MVIHTLIWGRTLVCGDEWRWDWSSGTL